MKRFTILLILVLAFCINTEAQYYTVVKQKGDTIYLEKKLKEHYILKWTRYVYIDKKDRAFRVYFNEGKFVYSKNHVVRRVPRKVVDKIQADIIRRKESAANNTNKEVIR